MLGGLVVQLRQIDCGQMKRKDAAAAGTRCVADHATLRLDEALRDGETETGTGYVRTRATATNERLEHLLRFIRWNPGTAVQHRDDEVLALPARDHLDGGRGW